MREISIARIQGIHIGQVENVAAGTGCTVFVCEAGMRAGLDVRGGGPASRESHLLNPLTAEQSIHAIVLAGGSAYGLGAANGVMQYLEERGIGYDTGFARVPLVVQSDIYDLCVGDAGIRPDAAMGYAAAKHALEAPNYRDGNHGAGCGATVGKIAGMEYCMKTGIGSYAVVDNKFVGNTTLAVVMTNARFDKARLCKIAGMAHNGYARSIRPVHTSADGDSIYAVSLGDIEADQDLVGAMAAEVVCEAILRATDSAEAAYGHPARRDLKFEI